MRTDHDRAHAASTVALALGALGVVFGDIGTSPLYAFREAFEHHDLTVDQTNALGVASIAFWALVIIISIKYLAARDAGRQPRRGRHPRPHRAGHAAGPAPADRRAAGLVPLGVFGTALLYGDGLITPAISVLSAVEGFEVASSRVRGLGHPRVDAPSSSGSSSCSGGAPSAIGRVFGPVMVVWFVVLGVLGLHAGARPPWRAEGREPGLHRRLLRRASPASASCRSAASSSSSPAARPSTPTWATSVAGRSS